MFSRHYSWSTKNARGNQLASKGIAYCGLGIGELLYIDPPPPPYPKGFIGGDLTERLAIGNKYFVSFKVAYALDCYSIGVGMYVSYRSIDSIYRSDIAMVLSSDGTFNDKENWHYFHGSFIAMNNYSHIIIGPNLSRINNCSTFKGYFYVDDICLSSDSSTCITTVGIHDIGNKEQTDIYPNPASSFINVRCSLTSNKDAEIGIYDIRGKKMLTEKLTTEEQKIDISGLNNGIYILYQQNDKENHVKKLVIQK
jgi:hypothetical protein